MDAHTASSMERRVGTTMGGKYHLERLLGAGGMGTVFEATNTWTQRRVALKLMMADDNSSDEAVQRFFREARAAASVRHPHVVDVLDMGQDESEKTFFLVMEFLEGTNLGKHLQKAGKLPFAEASKLLAPVLDALSASHAVGVVHRDVKPDNIFLVRTARGEVVPKLIDFGIARMDQGSSGVTRSNTVMGTPAYMSPEQARGDRVIGPPADLWSIGAVLYQCLTGELPFDGENANQLLAAVLTREPVPITSRLPGLSPEVAALVHRSLERDLDRRYPNAEAFLLALLECEEVRQEPWALTLKSSLEPRLRATVVPLDRRDSSSSEQLTVNSPSSQPKVLPEAHTNAGLTAPATPRSTPTRRNAWVLPLGVGVALVALGAVALKLRSGESSSAPRASNFVPVAPPPPAVAPPPALALPPLAPPPPPAPALVEPPPSANVNLADAQVAEPSGGRSRPHGSSRRGTPEPAAPPSPAATPPPPPAPAAAPLAPAPSPPPAPAPAGNGGHSQFRIYE